MGNLHCRGILLYVIWIMIGLLEQGLTVLAVGGGKGCWDIFSPLYPNLLFFSPLTRSGLDID